MLVVEVVLVVESEAKEPDGLTRGVHDLEALERLHGPAPLPATEQAEAAPEGRRLRRPSAEPELDEEDRRVHGREPAVEAGLVHALADHRRRRARGVARPSKTVS